MIDWIECSVSVPPNDQAVLTKIDDEHGPRNEQVLRLVGRLWWFEDMSMYVYYAPTHWRPLT